VSETQGMLDDGEYRLYIIAQIRCLKAITNGEIHALIEPNCLVGPKAWKRWRIWKEKFDQAHKRKTAAQTVNTMATPLKIKAEFDSTKMFLEEQFGENYTGEHVEKAVLDGRLATWVAQRKVCGYYASMSVPVRTALAQHRLKPIVEDVLYVSVNKEVVEYYLEKFQNELQR
jgi:hypothetical protein